MAGGNRRRRRQTVPPSGFATIRDLVSFLAGLGVIAHQVLTRETVDPTAMLVGVSLMGLPLVFNRDGGGGAR